jgi:hypothetical protein
MRHLLLISEYGCHEGNVGIKGIHSGARVEEGAPRRRGERIRGAEDTRTGGRT